MARGSQTQSALNTLTPSETRPLGLSGVPDRGQGTDLAKQTPHDSGATLRIAGTTGQLPLVSVILEPTQAYRTAMEEGRREASCTQLEGGDDQEKSLGRTPLSVQEKDKGHWTQAETRGRVCPASKHQVELSGIWRVGERGSTGGSPPS